MGSKSEKKYLYDAQQSVDPIYEDLREKQDFFDFEQTKLLRRAVKRQVEIMGNATEHLLEYYCTSVRQVTSLAQRLPTRCI